MSDTYVTYHGDTPFEQLNPKTQAALLELMRLAVQAVEDGTLVPEDDDDSHMYPLDDEDDDYHDDYCDCPHCEGTGRSAGEDMICLYCQGMGSLC